MALEEETNGIGRTGRQVPPSKPAGWLTLYLPSRKGVRAALPRPTHSLVSRNPTRGLEEQPRVPKVGLEPT
jgi:hypothetical protein